MVNNIGKIVALALVLLGLLLGLYAWVLTRHAPVPPPAAARPAPATYAVVVAARPLVAGQPLVREDLRVEHLPTPAAGTFDAPERLAGEVPTLSLGEGSPITESLLATGLARKLAPGERAVAVRVDEATSVGNRLRPGDWVDVFVLLKRDNGEIDRSQAHLLLAHRQVLAFGASSIDDPAPAQPRGTPAQAARTAVLAVPVQEVSRLALADTNARLLLALRNPKDAAAEPQAGQGAALAELSGSAAPPPPHPTPAARPAAEPGRPRSVEVIRGGSRELVPL